MSTATDTLTKTEIKTPSMWTVILHNDDYTPMDFVMAVLMQVFHQTQEQAYAITMNVHMKGRGNVGLYTKEIALTKAAQVRRLAESNGHPLLAQAEEA